MYYRLFLYGVLVAVLGATAVADPANDDVQGLAQDSSYWGLDGGNYSNWRYSGLFQINNKNIGDLRAAWSMSTGSLQEQAGGPLILPPAETGHGAPTLFLHTPFPDDVLAVKLDNLAFSWVYDSGQTPSSLLQQCCRYHTRGLAYAEGKLFLQQADERLVALDARSGKSLWATAGSDSGVPSLTTGIPVPVGDYLLAGFNTNSRGGITAYRISDGKTIWRAFNSGTDGDALFDAQTRFISGRSADLGGTGMGGFTDVQWDTLPTGPPAWDSRENLIFYAGMTPLTTDATGRKRYAMALYARDLATGKARWVFELTADGGGYYRQPGEVMLADIKLDGNQVPALVYFSSSGFVYVVNRLTGELLQAQKFDASVNWASAVNLDTGRPVFDEDENKAHDALCPSPIGARGAPPAYSPHTGLFYVPAAHTCMGTRLATGTGAPSGTAGTGQAAPQVETFLMPAGAAMKDNTTNMGMLVAWDVSQGRPAWSVPESWPVLSGVLVTAGDEVFYGTLDGYLKAVDAWTGKPLWQFKVPSGVIGNVTTWSYKDKQFVGVLSGSGDTTALLGGDEALNVPVRPGGTLMVFSLP